MANERPGIKPSSIRIYVPLADRENNMPIACTISLQEKDMPLKC